MFRRTIALLAVALAAAVATGAATAARVVPTAPSPPVHAVAGGTTAVAVTVFPTGDGPGDEEVCGQFGVHINHQLDVAVADFTSGDWASAVEAVQAADNVTDMALDAGCAVID